MNFRCIRPGNNNKLSDASWVSLTTTFFRLWCVEFIHENDDRKASCMCCRYKRHNVNNLKTKNFMSEWRQFASPRAHEGAKCIHSDILKDFFFVRLLTLRVALASTKYKKELSNISWIFPSSHVIAHVFPTRDPKVSRTFPFWTFHFTSLRTSRHCSLEFTFSL